MSPGGGFERRIVSSVTEPCPLERKRREEIKETKVYSN
jgi:hypothetical protein